VCSGNQVWEVPVPSPVYMIGWPCTYVFGEVPVPSPVYMIGRPCTYVFGEVPVPSPVYMIGRPCTYVFGEVPVRSLVYMIDGHVHMCSGNQVWGSACTMAGIYVCAAVYICVRGIKFSSVSMIFRVHF
jgi:hypothetical protein